MSPCSRRARTTTIAISRTSSRRCRATVTRRCSAICSIIPASPSSSAPTTGACAHRLHRPGRRVLRSLPRPPALPLARLRPRTPRVGALSTARRRELPERIRVHADHGNKTPRRPACGRDVDREGTPGRRGRSLSSDPERGERGARPALRGASAARPPGILCRATGTIALLRHGSGRRRGLERGAAHLRVTDEFTAEPA